MPFPGACVVGNPHELGVRISTSIWLPLCWLGACHTTLQSAASGSLAHSGRDDTHYADAIPETDEPARVSATLAVG
jgi:hypothetical protein